MSKKRRFLITIVLFVLVFFLFNTEAKADSVVFEDTLGYSERGHAKIIGQVCNNTNNPVTYVMVAATIYDKTGGIIDTGFTFTILDNLMPGESSPFDLTVMQAGEEFARYSLNVEWKTGTRPDYRDLEIVQSRGFYQGDNFKVVGEIKNTGNSPAKYVMIVCTGYDGEKKIAGVGFTFSTISTIQPGAKSPFDLTIINPPRKIETYLLQVQGKQ